MSLEIDDSTEYWRDIKEARQEKRANNRAWSAQYLKKEKIPFIENNLGAHLIIGNPAIVDFWPGTGLWISRNKEKGYGLKNLIAYINRKQEAKK